LKNSEVEKWLEAWRGMRYKGSRGKEGMRWQGEAKLQKAGDGTDDRERRQCEQREELCSETSKPQREAGR